MRRIILAALLVLSTPALALAPRPALAVAPFSDVSSYDPAYTAINELAARGVIKGYPTTPPTFGPGDKSLRAQMAALIGRGMGWPGGTSNPFQDRCNAGGCIDQELWDFIAALASRGVAKGYDATTYAPFDNVLKQQVILFIARAKVQKGEWFKQADNPRVYPGSAGSVSDHQDIVTYAFYAGAPPDAPTTFDTAWGDSASEATRGWFARALWQAYPEGSGTALKDPSGSPSPSPSPGASPSSSPSASPSAQPSPSPSPSPHPQCDPSYPTVCIPPPPPDLNCTDIPYRNFTVLSPDPHHFDTDHDGIGCETGS